MTVLEVTLAVFVVVMALLTAAIRDLVGAVTTFAAFSLGIAIAWLALAAPDVGLIEAAVGAGVMAMLLLVALVRTAELAPETPGPRSILRPTVDLPAALVVAAVALALAYSVTSFPAVGDPTAASVSTTDPAGNPTPYSMFVTADVGVPNAVAAVLVIFRGLDTFGEVIVAFTAVIGVLVVLGRDRMIESETRTVDEDNGPEHRDGVESRVAYPDPYVMSPVVTTAIRSVVPLVFAFGVFLTFHGTTLPAGGFQGGVVMGSAIVLLALAFGLRPTIDWLDERALVVTMAAGVGIFVAVAFGPVVVNRAPFELLAYAEATAVAVELVEVGIGLLVGGVVTTLVAVLSAGMGTAGTTDQQPTDPGEGSNDDASEAKDFGEGSNDDARGSNDEGGESVEIGDCNDQETDHGGGWSR